MNELDSEWDFERTIRLFNESKVFIVIAAILGALIGYIYNAKMTVPKYSSTISILLSVIDVEKETDDLNADMSLNQKLEATYIDIIKSENFLSKVKENLQIEDSVRQLLENISTSKNANSTVMKVNVSNVDPVVARNIAAEISNVFTQKIEELYGVTSTKVLDEPQISTSPSNINPKKFALIGALIGAVSVCFIAIVRASLNQNVKEEVDIEKGVGIPVIAKLSKEKSKRRLVALNSNATQVESFRVLASNIKFAKRKIILITSNSAGEGKSWVTSNLAVTYAKSNKRVLLIDADMRCGVQDEIFGIAADKKGLSNLIDEDMNISNDRIEQCTYNAMENLDIITKGNANLDFSKLLFSKVVEELINIVREKYDYIIIDGTPFSLVADVFSITKIVDITLFVVKYDNTKIKALVKMKENIQRMGGNVYGAVINCVPIVKRGYGYGYDYGYGYGYGYSNYTKDLTVKVEKGLGAISTMNKNGKRVKKRDEKW